MEGEVEDVPRKLNLLISLTFSEAPILGSASPLINSMQTEKEIDN